MKNTSVIGKQSVKNLVPIALVVCLGFISCSKKVVDDTTPPPAGGGTTPPPTTDTVPSLATARSWLVDKAATLQTAALFYKLKKTAKTNILFGHQDDTKRGVGWANEEGSTYQPLKSDVKDITGAYPAVYGWDFNFIAGTGTGNWFNYENSKSHDLTVDAYNRGGVNTYCWHYQNPVSGGGFYWSDSPVEAVSRILPGGDKNGVFKNDLKKVADFSKTLVGSDGNLVPVIFRPFHEFDGDWFWWGAAHCTADQYKALYQFTVTYLRDSLNVRNFLYAWSPDKNFTTLSALMARYPGDAYVDVVGSDNYGDLNTGVSPSIASNKLLILSNYAKTNNKVAALTETGLNKIPQSDWFTNNLLGALTTQKLELAYVLLWANRTDSYWTPNAGHAAVPNFISFKNNSYLLFGDKIPNMYELK